MKKRLIVLFLLIVFISCEKEKIPDCWICKTMYQKNDEVIREGVYCDKTVNEIIMIADSLNTYKVTYTNCHKIENPE